MSHATITPGFHPIRSEHLLKEHVHDAYKSKGKLKEPTVCPQCNAVFHNGRWQWMSAPTDAHKETCPACHRIHDNFPAGFLTIQGEFFHEHRDEIINLAHNLEKRERAEHPLKRIIAMEEKDHSMQVATTDIHLARGIGEALHHAYQGTLEFHYNPEQCLLRVHWAH